MIQIIKQTYEEEVAMYMKLPKKKLVEMLVTCHIIMDEEPKWNVYEVKLPKHKATANKKK